MPKPPHDPTPRTPHLRLHDAADVPTPGGDLSDAETQRLLEVLRDWGQRRRNGADTSPAPPGPTGRTTLGSMGSREVRRHAPTPTSALNAAPRSGGSGDAGGGSEAEPLGLLRERDWEAAIRRIRGEAVLRGDQHRDHADGPRQGERADRQIACLLRMHDASHRGRSVFRVLSRNVSPGGLSLLHGRELSAGDEVTIALERGGGLGQILPGVVRWCRRIGRVGPDAAAVFEAGVELNATLRVDA